MKQHVPSLRVDGPGFVTGHATTSSIRFRPSRSAPCSCGAPSRALRPRAITLFDTPVDPWFKPDGYRQSSVDSDCDAAGGRMRAHAECDSGGACSNRCPPVTVRTGSKPLSDVGSRGPDDGGQAAEYGSALSHRRQRSRPRRGRILFGDGFNDYFGPVIRLLVESGIDAFAVTPAVWENTSWAYYYPPHFVSHEERRTRLAIGSPQIDDMDRNLAILSMPGSRAGRGWTFSTSTCCRRSVRSCAESSGPVRRCCVMPTRLPAVTGRNQAGYGHLFGDPSLPQKRLAHLSIHAWHSGCRLSARVRV